MTKCADNAATCSGGAPDGTCSAGEPCTCNDCFTAPAFITTNCVNDGTCDTTNNEYCVCPDCDGRAACTFLRAELWTDCPA